MQKSLWVDMVEPYQLLETQYAASVCSFYGISTNTGTSALHLALKSLGIGPGDEVIVPEYTMIASAWAVTYCGAKPVFVDCGDDLLIDVEKIERKITKKTKAIMPVHIYGRVCNMDAIMKIAKRKNLRVVEDACEAQMATYKGRPVGSFDIGCFSFFKNKIIPAQEGGMITTSDAHVYKKAQYLKNMSFSDNHDYLHDEIGFNYRMSNAQADIALSNFEYRDAIVEERKKVEGWYDKHINPLYKRPKRDVVWVYDIDYPNPKLLVDNIKGARYGFKPMSMQVMYCNQDYKELNAYRLSKTICYLPVTPFMNEEDVVAICAKIDSLA